MDSPESGDSNPPVLVSNLRSRKQNMTKTAQHSKRSKDLTGDGAFAGCVRQTFPSPATWWVFNHHNRNLHEWSGIRSTRMYPSDPTQKQVLVVRPRGGRSGKNWRIFVRPREVVVKIIISPKATGRRWNIIFLNRRVSGHTSCDRHLDIKGYDPQVPLPLTFSFFSTNQ